jgi:hypothetical protein
VQILIPFRNRYANVRLQLQHDLEENKAHRVLVNYSCSCRADRSISVRKENLWHERVCGLCNDSKEPGQVNDSSDWSTSKAQNDTTVIPC